MNLGVMLWKWVAAIIAVFIGILLLFALGLQMKINAEVHQKIRLAVESRYPGKRIAIRREDKGPLRQLCYELDISDPVGNRARRAFAMIEGDADGGVWSFAREYASMELCKAGYSRG